MTDEFSPGGIVGRIEKAVKKLKGQMPPMERVLSAYGEVLVEKARLREDLPLLEDSPLSGPDPFRFSQGVPLLTEDTIIHFTDSLEDVYDRMLPVLERSFPKIGPLVRKLEVALGEKELHLKSCMETLLNGGDEKLGEIAFGLGTDSLTLKFILSQLMKPFIEKLAESYKPLIQNLTWHRGYCPICGSFPELSYLVEKEGQRWLRCSLCGHEWRFMRTKCPFCENDDPEKMEFYFIEDRSHERAEICYQCKRYLVSIDLRKCSDEVVLEVASLGMVYLDILAQGRGYLPVAVCAWNVVSPRDISSSVEHFESYDPREVGESGKKSSETILAH
jgi:FdhE protein